MSLRLMAEPVVDMLAEVVPMLSRSMVEPLAKVLEKVKSMSPRSKAERPSLKFW